MVNRQDARNGRSFRLGSTSYVFAAGLVENARRLRGVVDDMQLVLWRTDEGATNIPTPDEVARLREAAGDALGLSLHLPTFLRLTAADPTARACACDEAIRLLRLCAPLDLSVIVAHLEGDEPALDDEAGWQAWRERARASLALLRQFASAPVCVENIERYPIERALPLLDALGQPLCVDVGHHLKVGQPAEQIVRARLHRAQAVHLHGWDGVADHQPLAPHTLPDGVLDALLGAIHATRWPGVLTLELFGEADFFPSLAYLNHRWASWVHPSSPE